MKTTNPTIPTGLRRVILHAVCMVRCPQHFAWHWLGIGHQIDRSRDRAGRLWLAQPGAVTRFLLRVLAPSFSFTAILAGVLLTGSTSAKEGSGPEKTQDIALGKRFSVPPAPEGKCRLIVYWPCDDDRWTIIQPSLSVNGTSIGTLKPMGYLQATADPGAISVTLAYKHSDGQQYTGGIALHANRGAEVYLLYMIGPTNKQVFANHKLSLQQVPVEKGREAALKTRESTPE